MAPRLIIGLAAALLTLGGCKSSNPPPRTGFISDYSRLVADSSTKASFVSPRLGAYDSFIIDPIQMRIDYEALKPEQRAEVANYFRGKFIEVLEEAEYRVTGTPGVGVARVRIAMTDIKSSTWWMNLHPASKLTGAGTGGASMEGEVIDSVSGEQLAAVVQSGRGNQFELDTFSKLDDIKDSIDAWARNAGERLEGLRAEAP